MADAPFHIQGDDNIVSRKFRTKFKASKISRLVCCRCCNFGYSIFSAFEIPSWNECKIEKSNSVAQGSHLNPQLSNSYLTHLNLSLATAKQAGKKSRLESIIFFNHKYSFAKNLIFFIQISWLSDIILCKSTHRMSVKYYIRLTS